MALKTKSVSIDLPQDLLKKLKHYQQKQNIKSSADAIIAALQAFLALEEDVGAYAPLDRLINLEQQVDRLIQQIAELRAVVAQPAPKTTAPEHDRSQAAPSIASAPSNYEYEDFEDEPDEILYGFLEPEDRP